MLIKYIQHLQSRINQNYDEQTIKLIIFVYDEVEAQYNYLRNQKQWDNLCSIFSTFSEMKAKIVILGLDGAGKTTILYQMKLKELVPAVPTVGFNVEQIKYKDLSFSVWDISARSKIIDMWHHYYQSADAVIYVLDAADQKRIETAKETVRTVIRNSQKENFPILFFFNKTDISKIKPNQLIQKMEMLNIKRDWHMQPCCGLNGEGIVEGFEWLRKAVKNKPRK